jgi:hypothetical protein
MNADQRTFAMADEWLTYAQAAERLNTTVEAVRLRALRGVDEQIGQAMVGPEPRNQAVLAVAV